MFWKDLRRQVSLGVIKNGPEWDRGSLVLAYQAEGLHAW